jgi:uncharacterized protein (DUF952 family)
MIYHILPQAIYTSLDKSQPFRADTLESEGFMHCTGAPALLVWVANRFYRQADGLFIVLCIDEALVTAEVRWEESDGHLFPHIYGPLNWSAVEKVIDFPRSTDGTFLLPPALQ